MWSLGVTVFVALTAIFPFGSGNTCGHPGRHCRVAFARLAHLLQLTLVAAPHERVTLDTLLALLSTADNDTAPPPPLMVPPRR